MNKNRVLAVLAAISCILLPCYAYAASPGAQSIKSHGNIAYGGDDGAVKIYSEDIALLHDEIFSLSGRIFRPGDYAHVHKWQYFDRNEETHTKRCDLCGSSKDITNRHKADSYDKCDITYNGAVYAGYAYICECGYGWTKEVKHHVVYEPGDDTHHVVRCRLANTEYCSGLTGIQNTGDHVLSPGNDLTDDTPYHMWRCDLCGYEREKEECVFTDHYEVSEDLTEITWFCECGNNITEPYTDMPDISPDEREDTGEESGTKEESETEEINEAGESNEEEEDSEVEEGDEEEASSKEQEDHKAEGNNEGKESSETEENSENSQ